MMCRTRVAWSSAVRGVCVACVSLLGLVAIVGSGGGFPECTAPFCGPAQPPLLSAHIQPFTITALVGTPVTYTVETSNLPGALSYQWSRSPDGNPPCAAGESCPDFSATAAPMRFGYWRISYGMTGDTIAHGIDNWKVTVWRR